jgi:excisionase family DNA binding protein
MSLRVIDGDQQPERYVDRREMASILGISLRTLDRMVANDEIPSCTWGRRSRRFLPSVVIAAFARAEVRANSQEAA